jgi:hypothetical protein
MLLESRTLTGCFNSVCSSGNANGLVVVVGLEIVFANAFVGVVFQDGFVVLWTWISDALVRRYDDCDDGICSYLSLSVN